jgi:iron complex transport system substrate-binding protein
MKDIRKMFVSLFILLWAFTLVACQNNDTTENEEANKGQNEENTEASNETKGNYFPITIKDALENEVTFDEEPETIVSLIPSNTEIVYALGAGEKVIGVSDLDNYPEDVLNKEKIGSMEYNIEKIISLKPDVVLAHESIANYAAEGFQQLQDAGLSVYIVKNASSFEDVYHTIETIGKITGTYDASTEVVNSMKSRVEEIKEMSEVIKEEEKLVVWTEISPAPDLFTTGKGTFMHEMLEMIGAQNAAGNQEGWPPYTEEDAVLLNPDIILVTYNFIDNPVDQVLTRDAWANVPAVQNKRVYEVNDDLVSRPGPRLLEGVEELATKIYPEIYK